MEYKNDKLYRAAALLAAASVVDMIITFLMMSYSSNTNLILWFFAGGILLVITNFIMVSVKRKYERVYEDEPSVGEIVKENALSFKGFLFKRKVAGFIALLILVASIVFFLISGVKTLSVKYEKAGTLNAGYHFNLREAERFYGLMEEELQKGNDKLANEFRLNAEKCESDSEWYFERYEVLCVEFEEILNMFKISATALVLAISGYITFTVIYNKRQRLED